MSTKMGIFVGASVMGSFVGSPEGEIVAGSCVGVSVG